MSPSFEDLMEALERDDNIGFCRDCGEGAYGVESDARGVLCEECGQPGVYGAEEWLYMIDV